MFSVDAKQAQPPLAIWFLTSHSNALFTLGSSSYPNLTSALAVLPTMHSSLLFEPSVPNPPSFFEKCSIHSSQALAILGSSRVSPRSDKMSSIQLLDMNLGR